jgi:hypothetical protein
MRNGDISNELPKRIIVITDVFLKTELTLKKRFAILRVPEVEYSINRMLLSNLYLYTSSKEVTLELASFDMDDEALSNLMDKLDRMGTNPFRYYTSYESIDHLVSELPYRPEVVGVLDLPNRQLRYGHWGLDQI